MAFYKVWAIILPTFEGLVHGWNRIKLYIGTAMVVTIGFG